MAPPRSATERPAAFEDVVGARFARALAAKDGPALEALLHPEVDFRALTPRRTWESSDAAEVVDGIILGTWFGADRRICEVLDVEVGDVGPLHWFRYRFGVEQPDGRFVIEQQVYASVTDDRISSLRILCSGFLPVAP